MSGIAAIRCPGCKKLVNIEELEAHYKDSKHEAGVVTGASTITTANPTDNQRFPAPYPPPGPPYAYPGAYPPKGPRVHLFDSPVWGPLLRRYFPHILFGAFAVGVALGVILW